MGGRGGLSSSATSSVSCWLSRTVSILGLAERGREAEEGSAWCFLNDLGRVEDRLEDW